MSLSSLKETVELWHRINNASSGTLEESLKTGSMSNFLLLEDSQEAVVALNQEVDKTMAELKALAGSLPSTMGATKKSLEQAIGEVTSLRLKPSPKIKIFSLGDPVKKASKVMANAASLTATIVSAGQTMMSSMNDLDIALDSKDSLNQVILSAKEANPDKQIPDEAAFLKGVQKSWQPPAGVGNAIKGFLGAIGIGGGSDFFGLTAEIFAKDLLQSSPADIMTFLNSKASKDQTQMDDKELAGLDDKLAAAGADKEALAGGGKEGEAGGAEGEGKEAEGGSTGKKWSEISSAYLKTVDDQGAGKKFLDTLKSDKNFSAAVADLINLEESMYRTSLSTLLFEKVDFETLKSAAGSAAKEEEAQVSLARGLAKVLSDQGVEVSNIPPEAEAGEAEGEAEEEGLPSEKEAAAEQEQAQAELQQAVKDEAGQNQSPASAAQGAIDSWVQGLSKTSQSSLQAKKRVDSLKQVVQGSLDQAAAAVEKQVAKAIKGWRGEHEETLMKSKRFAKKNFDSLQSLVPQLAAAMLKKSNESTVRLTHATINRTVYSYLDKKFNFDKPLISEALINPNSHASDTEKDFSEDDMVKYRWMKMAGLGK